MRFGFVVNDLTTEEAGYTTTRLAVAATNRGHEAWTIGVGDLAYDPDEYIRATAVRPPRTRYKDGKAYLRDLHGSKAIKERVTVDDLDVLFLRNVPSDEKGKREWAKTAAVDFGRVAMRHGVIVLNDPNGLAKAENKMYFQLFPEEVRPRTLITRDRDLIKSFVREEGRAVIKPLQGSGGEGVFLVRADDAANLNQMIDAVARDGHIIVQEYLPLAENGDTRLFLMNGEPLRHKGRATPPSDACARGETCARTCTPAARWPRPSSPRRRSRWPRSSAPSSCRTGCSSSGSTSWGTS